MPIESNVKRAWLGIGINQRKEKEEERAPWTENRERRKKKGPDGKESEEEHRRNDLNYKLKEHELLKELPLETVKLYEEIETLRNKLGVS